MSLSLPSWSQSIVSHFRPAQVTSSRRRRRPRRNRRFEALESAPYSPPRSAPH